jgi:hypothetical protein
MLDEAIGARRFIGQQLQSLVVGCPLRLCRRSERQQPAQLDLVRPKALGDRLRRYPSIFGLDHGTRSRFCCSLAAMIASNPKFPAAGNP